MCGIAGILHRDGAPLDGDADRATLAAMAQVLDHRGPDDKGLELRGSAGLAFARLSIIDIEGGHQPMTRDDGRYAIVFNGEIYNFAELRDDLQRQGFRFATNSDTEVLLACYQRYGTECVHRLNGMFALAIHDRSQGSLFLARDRLGIKPLYTFATDRLFVFASELKAILLHPDVSNEIDPAALSDYLTYGFVVAPRTIYRHVREIPPGHCLTVGTEGPKISRYWRVARKDLGIATVEDAADELERLLEDAVRQRLVADVPVGALLSGGIDSGLVVALMSRCSSRAVKTFSVGFSEERYDELPWARRVAERYATDHTEILCTPDIHELVPRLALAFDQPFGDSSAVPTYLVCQEARRRVTVALSGDGGDEVFAGYARHMRFVRGKGRPSPWSSVLEALAPLNALVPPTLRGAQRLRRLCLDERARQVDSLVILEDRIKRRLAGPRLRGRARDGESVRLGLTAGGVFEEEGGLRRFQHQDLTLYLPNDILPKVDRMSMLESLEVRVPLLDHRVVEFGLNLTPALKNDGTFGKLVLRELARRHLPPEHLTKRKSGFAIPAKAWLAGPLRELLVDNLGTSRLAEDGWFDGDYLRRLLGARETQPSRATVLWSLLVAELWYRSRSQRPRQEASPERIAAAMPSPHPRTTGSGPT